MDTKVDYNELTAEFTRRVKILNERIWEGNVKEPAIERWLSNFVGEIETVEVERLYALHLLSNFMYFGAREMRELLRSLYRDHISYPLLKSIREANADTTQASVIEPLFNERLARTRFLGIGNPSESGTNLLYFFRQENRLSKKLFINSHEIFSYTMNGLVSVADPTVEKYVFLDDLAGSGNQAVSYSKGIVSALKTLSPTTAIHYYVLFATTEALATVRNKTLFDSVEAVFELDESFYCFGPRSRYYTTETELDASIAQRIIGYYGWRLWADFPLGYDACQLLLGFHHNTPDNTLPVIWNEGVAGEWAPIFKRYPKSEW